MSHVALGLAAVLAALAALLGMVFWSRSIVERIYHRHLKTLREIRKGLSRDR